MAVKIGIHGGQQDIEMDELRRMWRFADSNGFDFISLWDHFYEAPPIDGDSPVFEAIAGMAALAAETENARIGCHVLCVTYRNPGLLANSIMTIDHISHGRSRSRSRMAGSGTHGLWIPVRFAQSSLRSS